MNPSSRVLQPGRTCCDGYPACEFTGKGEALRDHMRECRRSEIGDLYRTLASARAIAVALKEKEAAS